MSRRFNIRSDAPGGLTALLGVERYVHGSGLERSLIDLVNLRVSQINGCAFWLNIAARTEPGTYRPGALSAALSVAHHG